MVIMGSVLPTDNGGTSPPECPRCGQTPCMCNQMTVTLTGPAPDADRLFFMEHFPIGTKAVLELVCDFCKAQEGFSPSCEFGCAEKIQKRIHEMVEGIKKAKVYVHSFWVYLDDKVDASEEAVRAEVRKRDKMYKIPPKTQEEGQRTKSPRAKIVAVADPDKQAAALAAGMGMTLEEAKAFINRKKAEKGEKS